MTTYDQKAMQRTAHNIAVAFWKKAQIRFGAEVGYMPVIEMNARLTSTAGRAWVNHKGYKNHAYEKIDLSCYLMERNPQQFAVDVIPHELAHFIAYRIYTEKNHGQAWKYVMQEIGVPNAQARHSMESKNQAEKKMAIVTRKRITSEV